MLKQKGILLIILIIVIVVLASAGLAIYYLKIGWPILKQNANTNATVNLEPITANLAVANKNLISKDDLELKKAVIEPKIPKYDLPLEADQDIKNYSDVVKKIGLSLAANDLLQKNGFVVIDTPADFLAKADDFADYYGQLESKELPVFITSDSMLHYYHIFFDTTLMKLERDLFYDDVWQMSQELYNESLAVYSNSTGDLQEAAKRNLAYLSVAMELLKPKPDQVATDKTLKAEYCEQYMDEATCQMVIKGVKEQYGDKTSFKYFSNEDVQKYNFQTSDIVTDTVAAELDLISRHEGWKNSPLFVYKEDYSQYVPRGHYTKSEKLKNYFQAMIWFGRMTDLLNGTDQLQPNDSACDGRWTGIVSDYDAKIQTLQAELIAAKFLGSQDLQNHWQRMYAITGFFAGFSDDLGPYEYGQAIEAVLGKNFSVQDLETKFTELKNKLNELNYAPKIYSGLGACQMIMSCPPLLASEVQNLKVQAKTLLNQTKGFRLMGQRFALDSYLFSEIVSPYSGQYSGEISPLPTQELPLTFSWDDPFTAAQKNRPFTWVKTQVAGCSEGREVRGFPTGLDVLAIFGSDRAKEVISQIGDDKYSDYQTKFDQLKKEIEAMPQEDWYKNIYNNWLYVLNSLPVKYGQGYQSFMQTAAWQDKELNTSLASWSELRHDTILYVKQSYTIAELGAGEPPPIVGYVEPVPEFYVRLLNLTNLTKKGLDKLVPQDTMDNLKIDAALTNFSSILEKLQTMSQKELANQALSDQENEFIRNFGDSLVNLISTLSGGDVDPQIFKSVMVADVHTEGNVKKVLEEGVGYIKTLLAAYKLPDNRILLGVGPVFSYYEFKQDMDNRLTDEAWRQMLDSDKHPALPSWTQSFTE
ncbi:MAG: DUF3160 domain-containing protein [Patescibacteria group bacterium]